MYDSLPSRFTELDRRNLHYRFDLERDFDWKVDPGEGIHFPIETLVRLGVNVSIFEGRDDLRKAFDWGSALGLCRAFSVFEQMVVDFADQEAAQFVGVKSIAWLREEEVKHTAMFDRYADKLIAARPDLVPLSQEGVDQLCRTLSSHMSAPKHPGSLDHYVFWAITTFFEEITVAIDEYLRESKGETINPLWSRLHTLHRREETQHLITDAQCLSGIHVDPSALSAASAQVALGVITGDYWHYFGVSVGAAVVKALAPDLPSACPVGRVTQRQGFKDFLFSSKFRRSREALPYLKEIAANSAA